VFFVGNSVSCTHPYAELQVRAAALWVLCTEPNGAFSSASKGSSLPWLPGCRSRVCTEQAAPCEERTSFRSRRTAE